jgi:1-aminocyclopropane-1-carboxylate deaminase/D-cysteine desulfhydrase-like pyridoxal-dependent ACC family enzyme
MTALHDTCPELASSLPTAGLARPTPIVKLERLGRALGHPDLWIKRDDLTGEPYGGNKVRKLDFILAHAGRCGVRALATSGAMGSHHVLATCIYGKRLGFEVGALVFPVPMDSHLQENHERIKALADWVVELRSSLLIPHGGYAWKKARIREGYRPEELLVIPPGGSSPLGALGYVSAALEIEQQRREMNMSPFDHVYTALGTCGTFAGLVVGFRMAGAPSEVTGVQVASPLIANRLTAAYLVRKTGQLIESCMGTGGAPVMAGGASRSLRITHDYLGAGYAQYGRAERDVMAILRDEEDIVLDPVYTAKTMRAFLDHVQSPGAEFNKFLFTLTCDNGIKKGGSDEALQ